jgi:translation initiation factor 2 beta subunit (eIF-2beta)/eIF-5
MLVCKHNYVPVILKNKIIRSDLNMASEEYETFYLYCSKCGNIIPGPVK